MTYFLPRHLRLAISLSRFLDYFFLIIVCLGSYQLTTKSQHIILSFAARNGFCKSKLCEWRPSNWRCSFLWPPPFAAAVYAARGEVL